MSAFDPLRTLEDDVVLLQVRPKHDEAVLTPTGCGEKAQLLAAFKSKRQAKSFDVEHHDTFREQPMEEQRWPSESCVIVSVVSTVFINMLDVEHRCDLPAFPPAELDRVRLKDDLG